MEPRWRFAIVAGGACTSLVACGGLVTPGSAPAEDAALEATFPPPPATDATSPPDAAGEESAPPDAGAREAYSPPCTHGESSCALAKECAEDLAYGLDTGESPSPGVHLFVQEQDAVAYMRSLGFHGTVTADYVEFTAGGDPYVYAQLYVSVFVVADGTVAPDVYGALVRYVQCTYARDASADAEDGAAD